ncbi:MAG: hypothetical protein GEU98_19195 [Pseudonocardiaceae bacterium]|nr:hypothetical protein [Pseudonocardiaceae bacterium]
MPGYEPIRDDEATGVLPGTVAAAHLESCAAGLAGGVGPANVRECLGRVGDLAEVIQYLVAGQQHISSTLAGLAEHVHDRHVAGPLATAPMDDVVALTEVLRAAASAARHSAEALAETAPMLENVAESAGPDTRL